MMMMHEQSQATSSSSSSVNSPTLQTGYIGPHRDNNITSIRYPSVNVVPEVGRCSISETQASSSSAAAAALASSASVMHHWSPVSSTISSLPCSGYNYSGSSAAAPLLAADSLHYPDFIQSNENYCGITGGNLGVQAFKTSPFDQESNSNFYRFPAVMSPVVGGSDVIDPANFPTSSKYIYCN